jgi:COP9 signalosome complex subunit 5
LFSIVIIFRELIEIYFSTSTLLTNADYITGQINDVADKLEQAESHLGRSSFIPLPDQDKKQDDRLAKAAKDW